MKHVIVQTCSSIMLYLLLGWTVISLQTTVMTSMTALETNQYVFELNLLPFFVLILFFIGWTIYSYNNRPNQNMSFGQWSVRMTEYSEVDEREALITAKATKSAYVSFSITLPLFMMSFAFYTLFSDVLPNYPVLGLITCLVIGNVTYLISWLRHFQR